MSHFAVLVIGDNPEEQLAPYHEYECTGRDDQYVIDVDCTDRVEKRLSEMVYVGKNDKGMLKYEHRKNKLENPKKQTLKEYYELAGLSVDDEIMDWFGCEKRDGKWINHTNPNAKWDWYVLGGRRHGFLMPKDGVDVSVYDNGRPTMLGMYLGQTQSTEGVNQLKKGELDDEKMNHAYEGDKKRHTFAVIKDGKWYEKGQMGRWATVSNDKGEEQRSKEFHKMIESLPDDTLISVYDCHI